MKSKKPNHHSFVKTFEMAIGEKVPGRGAFVLLLSVLWTYESLYRYLLIAINQLPLIGSELQQIVNIFILLSLVLLSIRYIIRFVNITDIIVVLIIILVSFAMLVFNPVYSFAFEDIALTFLTGCLPLYFVGKAMKDDIQNEDEMRYFYWLSLISVVTTVLYIYIVGFTLQAEWQSNMYFPYVFLPHLLLIFIQITKKITIINIAVFILGLSYIIILGNRGSLVCLILFVLIILIRDFLVSKSKKKLISIFIVVMISMLVYVFNLFEKLIVYLYSLSNNIGLSTKTLDLISGRIEFSDSGRTYILSNLFEVIRENPFGYGIAADRYFVGAYAHNIVVELWVEFGIFLGSMIFIALIALIIRALAKKSCDFQTKQIVWLFIITGFVKLFISGSYLSEPYIYVLIGLCSSLASHNPLLKHN